MRICAWSSDVCSSDLVEILDLGIARALHPRLIGRAVVAHHHRWRMVVALDQQARLVPDRQAERAERPRHPLIAQPPLGGPDQRGRNLGVFRLERSEEHTSELQSLMRSSYAVFC